MRRSPAVPLCNSKRSRVFLRSVPGPRADRPGTCLSSILRIKNPPKQGPFRPKQGSLGFQVSLVVSHGYSYVKGWNNSWGSKCWFVGCVLLNSGSEQRPPKLQDYLRIFWWEPEFIRNFLYCYGATKFKWKIMALSPFFPTKIRGCYPQSHHFLTKKWSIQQTKKKGTKRWPPHFWRSTEFPSPEDSCFTVKTTVGEPRHHRFFFPPATFSSWKNPIEFFCQMRIHGDKWGQYSGELTWLACKKIPHFQSTNIALKNIPFFNRKYIKLGPFSVAMLVFTHGFFWWSQEAVNIQHHQDLSMMDTARWLGSHSWGVTVSRCHAQKFKLLPSQLSWKKTKKWPNIPGTPKGC